MDMQPSDASHNGNPRRRKRSKLQIFREAYLPFVIISIILLIILSVVIGGAIRRGKQNPNPSSNPSGDAASLLQQEASTLLRQAKRLASDYDYEGAISLLNGFSGDIAQFPELQNAIQQYSKIKRTMISWHASEVANLSFHVLVTDLKAALADPNYGQNGNNSYNRNFITTAEFEAILQQLYDRGYILVNLSDFYTTDSTTKNYIEKGLLLPSGKTPIMLTETHCNYYNYMTDSNDDNRPDSGGAGFASKLVYNGKFYNEMIRSTGEKVNGNFDMVPILEDFIAEHPDFSYRGAKAILALSGYDGIFGYRVNAEYLSEEERKVEQDGAKKLADALRNAGYTLACYTYMNVDYSLYSAIEIKNDIKKWNDEIASVIGTTDVMVYARESDIGDTYTGNKKFDALYNGGYRFFLGSSPVLWNQVNDRYVRHNRLIVTASNLKHHSQWFADILNPDTILDAQRGNIPQ